MAVEPAVSSTAAGKRKRDDDAPVDVLLPASQLAANLKSTSPDALKQTLTSIRQATQIPSDQETSSIGPNDKRLVFARELLEDRGWMRLLEAWERIHDMAIPALQPLPLYAISNIIRLTSCHLLDHEVCSNLITPILPTYGGSSAENATLWNKLHSYLLNIQSQHQQLSGQGQQRRGGNDALVLATLQLLTHIVRFERGRFARPIVENIAWKAKSITRFPGQRKRAKGGKKKSSHSDIPSSNATFARPDVRLAFTAFLLAILHPSSISTATTSATEDLAYSADSGAPTSLKILLLNQDNALPHLTSILQNLPGDSESVTQYILAALQRSLLRDPKLPRNILVNLVRSADLLTLLLQIGAKSTQLSDQTYAMLKALCTIPGRGICFEDQGWYGRSASASSTASVTSDLIDSSGSNPLGNNGSDSQSESHSNVYNPLLNSFIQSQHFSPLYNSTHRKLLLEILTAAKELQPSFLNSMRGPFGGARMEPPLAGTASGSGARLGGLLAYRLMGQVLEGELPPFEANRPPPIAKAVTALMPNTLPRNHIIKGLRHTDRLVQWSTCGLLVRALIRIHTIQEMAARFAQDEVSWAAALAAISKECSKRLPDVSTVLQVIETTKEVKQRNFLLLEASLRAALLLLQVGQMGARGNSLAPSLDVRKLLNIAGLTEAHRAQSSDTEESDALKPIIQLHVLRILRISGFGSLFTSTNSDASTFSHLILISRSADVSHEVSKEATTLLSEVFNPKKSSRMENQVLFEGDDEEFEAWLSALPIVTDERSQRNIAHVITFLQDCLSRCSKNAYRYLESARKELDNVSEESSSSSDTTPVSPLFETFKEQLLIKAEKDLFSSPEALKAVLEYFCKLVPLLAGRLRPNVTTVMKTIIETVSKVLQQKQDPHEKMLNTLRNIVALISGDMKNHKVSSISQVSTANDLLLLDPLQENLAQLNSETSMPPHIVLLHVACAGSKDVDVKTLTLAEEDSARAKLTLKMISQLQGRDQRLKEFADGVLSRLVDAERIGKKEFKDYFLHSETTRHEAVLSSAIKMFDPLLEEDRASMTVFTDAALRSAASDSKMVSPLVSYLSENEQITLALKLATDLSSARKEHCLAGLEALRDVVHLVKLSDEQTTTVLSTLLKLPTKFAKNLNIIGLVIAISLDLLQATSPTGIIDVTDLNLAWLDRSITGADTLQALLIKKVQSAAHEFASRVLQGGKASGLLSSSVGQLPRSFNAYVRSGQTSAKPQLLAQALSSHLFSTDRQLGATCSESLQTLLLRDISAAKDTLTLVSGQVPERPGDAFQLGAYTLAAHLTAHFNADWPESTKSALSTFVQKLLDQGLAWLVRRFAEDDADTPELVEMLKVFSHVIFNAGAAQLAAPKAHLASPVLEAGLKRRFSERDQMAFLQVLARHTDVGEAQSSALFTSVLAHANFKAVTGSSSADQESIGRPIVISILHSFASRYPKRLLNGQNCRSLLDVYGGTLSFSDRLLFDLFKRFEAINQVTFASTAKYWSGTGSLSTSAPTSLEALLSLDPGRAFATCSAFPRERTYEYLEAGLTFPKDLDSSDPTIKTRDETPQRELYDPLWILLLLSATMNEQEEITGLQWLSITRSNAIGVAVCALSSKVDSVRQFAVTVLGGIYSALSDCELQEKDHLLMALDAIKNNLSSTLPSILPLTTTLFISHQLRLITSPSSILYPTFSHFLLQRSTFDISDVPILYSMLQSSNPDHWKVERLWMLKYLRDCLRSSGSYTLEWKVFKRRYTWELLCSLYNGILQSITQNNGNEGDHPNSSTTSGSSSLLQSRELIQEILLIATSRPAIAVELITRKGLFSWISQQLSVSSSDDSYTVVFLVHLLRNACLSMHFTGVLSKMDPSTAITWSTMALQLLQRLVDRFDTKTGLENEALHLLSTLSSVFVTLFNHSQVADEEKEVMQVDESKKSQISIAADQESVTSQIQAILATISAHIKYAVQVQEAAALDQEFVQNDQAGSNLDLQRIAEMGSAVVANLSALNSGASASASDTEQYRVFFDGLTASKRS
ncbi:unnamed protein product [Sympodiomycopsis kandeliae]